MAVKGRFDWGVRVGMPTKGNYILTFEGSYIRETRSFKGVE